MKGANTYEAVIGLEVHVQLATRSKIFSADHNIFGSEPNTNIGPVTIAHPGTLPVISKEVVEMAMKMGLALQCEIGRKLIFDRKNYFYPDLPKGYQITQDATPICMGGGLEVELDSGERRFIALTKIHLEEDAGKSIHTKDEVFTHVDLNRAGSPLIEIVTDPVIRNAEEAGLFLIEIRKIIRHLEISDGNMEEGSMRCDANVSIRLPGEELGSKVEVKNMNSVRNVRRAIDAEITRQTDMKNTGRRIISETRTYDVEQNKTFGMRTKEELNDYRYFPEPDLSPLKISQQWLDEVRSKMPPLPSEIRNRLVTEFNLPVSDAIQLSEEKSVASYFFDTARLNKNYKAIANWLMGPIKSVLNDRKAGIEEFPLKPLKLAEMIDLIDKGEVSYSAASQKLLHELIRDPEKDVVELAVALDLLHQESGIDVHALVEEILLDNPDKVKAYKNGKKGLLGMFMGELMKKSEGKINPKKANELILESLEKTS